MRVRDIIREISAATGWKQAEMAKKFDVGQGTVSKWMNDQQSPRKKEWDRVAAVIRSDPRLAHLRYDSESGSVPIMGQVGAGSIIEPDFEQAPPDGFYSVILPFPTPPDAVIGFVVAGDSMYPQFEAGSIILVYKDQKRHTDSYLRKQAVVRTRDGRRYLKTIFSGSGPNLYRLESFNAPPIQDVEIDWVGEIIAAVPDNSVVEADEEEPMIAPRVKTRPRVK